MSKNALPIAELKPALTGLGKVICKRCALPVLHHVKVEHASEGWIVLKRIESLHGLLDVAVRLN